MLSTFLHSASGGADLLAAKWRVLSFTGFVIAPVLFCTSCGALTQVPARVESLSSPIQAVGEPPKRGDKGLASADTSGAQGNEAVPQKGDANFAADGSEGLGERDDQKAAEQADDAVADLQALDPADPANLPAFRQALSDKDPTLKEVAIQALAGEGGPETLDLLREAFHNSDPAVRLMVIENVGSMPEAFPFLQEASRDADASVREAAQRWLDLQSGIVPDPVPAAGPGPLPTPDRHP